MIINYIACSLSTPHLPSRRLVLDLLTFLCYYEFSRALPNVLDALDALSVANGLTGRYTYWFKSLDASLDGRGKMGSLVGASDEVKRSGGIDSNLNEYAVRGFTLFCVVLC